MERICCCWLNLYELCMPHYALTAACCHQSSRMKGIYYSTCHPFCKQIRKFILKDGHLIHQLQASASHSTVCICFVCALYLINWQTSFEHDAHGVQVKLIRSGIARFWSVISNISCLMSCPLSQHHCCEAVGETYCNCLALQSSTSLQECYFNCNTEHILCMY